MRFWSSSADLSECARTGKQLRQAVRVEVGRKRLRAEPAKPRVVRKLPACRQIHEAEPSRDRYR